MIAEPRDVVLPRSREACLVALRSGKSTVTQIAMFALVSIKTASDALRDLKVLETRRAEPRGGLAPDIARTDVSRRPRRPADRATSVVNLPRTGAGCSPCSSSRRGDEASPRNSGSRARRPAHDAQAERARACQIRRPGRPVVAGHARRGRNALAVAGRGARAFGDPRRTLDERPADPPSYAARRGSDRNRPGAPRGLGLRRGRRRIQRRRAFPGRRRRSRASATPYGHPRGGAPAPARPSDRVRAVLSAIETAGALRIRDVRDMLRLPQKSANALAQYLKRKGLIRKTGELFDDPYVLTVLGCFTLAAMAEPGQMKSGYLERRCRSRGARAAPSQANQAIQRRVIKRSTSLHPSNCRDCPFIRIAFQAVLSVLSSAGALRSRMSADRLRLPHQSTNSLMQYLKRKALVEKLGEQVGAPFGLTALGRDTLAEMAQRRAA